MAFKTKQAYCIILSTFHMPWFLIYVLGFIYNSTSHIFTISFEHNFNHHSVCWFHSRWTYIFIQWSAVVWRILGGASTVEATCKTCTMLLVEIPQEFVLTTFYLKCVSRGKTIMHEISTPRLKEFLFEIDYMYVTVLAALFIFWRSDHLASGGKWEI